MATPYRCLTCRGEEGARILSNLEIYWQILKMPLVNSLRGWHLWTTDVQCQGLNCRLWLHFSRAIALKPKLKWTNDFMRSIACWTGPSLWDSIPKFGFCQRIALHRAHEDQESLEVSWTGNGLTRYALSGAPVWPVNAREVHAIRQVSSFGRQVFLLLHHAVQHSVP